MTTVLWWIGQNMLTVVLIIPCVALACRLFRDRPAVQHLLWLVVLLKFLTPPIVAWPWSAHQWQSLRGPENSGVHVTTLELTSAEPYPEGIALEAFPMDQRISPTESTPNPPPPSRTSVAPVVADIVSETPHPTTQVHWSRIIQLVAPMAWLIGAIVCFALITQRWMRVVQLMRGGVAAPSHLSEEVSRVASRLRTKAPACVVVKGIVSPFLWCAGTVRLVWPESIVGKDDVLHCRGIIAHELAHLRRRDHWITWLEFGASVLWWWNPLLWFVRWRLREAAEMSCDALAIAADPGHRHDYAQRLLQLSSQSEVISSCPVLGAGSDTVASFERRLKMILSPKTSGDLSWKGGVVMAVFAVIAFPYLSLAQTAMNHQRADNGQIGDSADLKQRAVGNRKETVVVNGDISDRTTNSNSAESSSRFEGRVLAPDGEPLAGAKVHVISHWNEVTKLGPVRATSDANGKFSFDAADMTWQQLGKTRRRAGLIVATKPGLVPEWMETWGDSRSTFRTGLWGPLKQTPIELQLARDGVPIRGQLLADNGKPLVGVNVRLTRVMVPRKRDLTGFLDRWSRAPTSATFLTGISYKRELAKHFELLNVKSDCVTDVEGRFELSGIGRDRIVQLEIKSPSIVTTSILVMTRAVDDVGLLLNHDGEPTQMLYGANFKFTPQQGLVISGVVRDRQTKQPVSGMWVKHRGYDPLKSPEKAKDMAVTDSAGRFVITGLNPNLLNYEAKHRDIDAVPQPGTQYLKSSGTVGKNGELIIESERGINFRLNIVDEDGKPVDATVEYHPINPNEVSADLINRCVNHAARRDDGSYEGFVVPGPGAILVKPHSGRYRPTFVDPKAFFAPGKPWDNKSNHIYGSYNTLAGRGHWYDQRKYAAVVLVNPVKDTKPLRLSVTLTRDQPRIVSLIDSMGEPVTNANATFHQWAGTSHSKMELSAATFPVFGLATNHDQEITFTHSERKLVGHLTIPFANDSALTVTMRPWATITGRFVDTNGKPLALLRRGQGFSITNDTVAGSRSFRSTINKGASFRVEPLVAGHRFTFHGVYLRKGTLTPLDVFRNLSLQPGETYDVGDVVVQNESE